ncbi:hypothetical protein KR026_011501, partial [Drosophila bipectinata]
VNVTKPEDVLTTPKCKFLDSRLQSLDTVAKPCSPEDVRILKDAAAKWLAEVPQTADSLFKPLANVRWSRVTFGCSALDRCTGGGVMTRGITEIFGAFGVGKTQLLLHLALGVQLPRELGGLGRGVAFICTGSPFPARRLFQISKIWERRYPNTKLNFLANVFVEHQKDAKSLMNCVNNRLPQLFQQHGIGLIVIDSVAAVFRENKDYLQRARELRCLTNALLSYSEKHNCAVVCVNEAASSTNGEEKAALGMQWAHLGRTRLRVTKEPKQHKVGDELFTVRRLEVMYSPETPNDFGQFLITSEGVVDVPQPTPPRPPPKIRCI